MTTTPMIGRVSSGWGKRKSKIPGMTTFHRGVDIAGPKGTDVVAPEAGVVIAASYNLIRGHYVVIDHGGGWSTSSQHLSKRLVLVGQHVAEGQRIGLSGRTGNVTGPHDHTEVRDHGTPIDPAPWYAARGVTLGVASAVLPEHVTAPTPAQPTQPDPFEEDDDMIERALQAAYRNQLGRTPGAPELDERILRIALGQSTLASEIRGIAGSAEAHRHAVDLAYWAEMHRGVESDAQADSQWAAYRGDMAALRTALAAAYAKGQR